MSGKSDDTNWIFIAVMLVVFPPLGVFLLVRALNASFIRDEDDEQRRQSAQRGKKMAGRLMVAVIMVMVLTGVISRFDWTALAVALAALYMAVAVGWRYVSHRRVRMERKYLAIIGNRGLVSIADVAAAMPVSYERACADIQSLIDQGKLPPTAYIDAHRRMLVMHPDALVDLDPVIDVTPIVEPARAAQPAKEKEPKPEPVPERTSFQARVDELHSLNDAIQGEAVSAKIDKIERLTASIFLAVEDSPEKLPQISRFMNYYLPTTIKLLRQYSRLERQSMGGENIARSMHDIEAILDKLVEGFERQLDQLYSADAIDITADINVLETMMARDGLTRNPYVFQKRSEP